MGEVILDIKNYVAGYGEIDVIKGVSAQIQRHEIACVIGPNGAGKSTLLKGVFGLIKA